MDRVLDGHPVAFQAMAEFLARGNRVTIIKGNHDVQFFWTDAQDALRNRLVRLAPRGKAAAVRRNLEFLPWFFHIPGFVYIEHGNQYEPATSFGNFLAPILPFDTPDAGRHIELDLGSFLVRYFSNRMEVLDIRADNYRPLAQYLQMFFREHPLVFLSTARDALRYLSKTVAKAHRTARGRKSRAYRDIVERNAKLLRGEAVRAADRSPAAVEELHRALQDITARKATPILSTGVNRYLRSLLRKPVRALLWIAPLYLMVFVADAVEVLTAWLTSGSSVWVQDVWRLLVFVRVPHLLLAGVVVAVALAVRQSFQRLNQRDDRREDPVALLRRAAAYAAGRLKVRYVVFGHSHAEDCQVYQGGGAYFNSGTWIGVLSEPESLYRAVHQFSFVKFQDGYGELLHWDPHRGEARPVIVVDATPFEVPERARWIRTLWNLLRRT